MFSTVEGAQYHRVLSSVGVFSTMEDTMSSVGVFSTMEDTMSTLGDVQYHGGFHNKCEGYLKYHGAFITIKVLK